MQSPASLLSPSPGERVVVAGPAPVLGAGPGHLDAAARRRFGAYYTPSSAADYMAAWAVRDDDERVLEPSFGDGIFLRAVTQGAARRGLRGIRLFGFEIDPEAHRRIQADGRAGLEAAARDFLAVRPFPVEAVIGNPPYVRLRNLPDVQRQRALIASHLTMGRHMDPSGSLWMPFVLHAMRFLRPGGRLAFVLPYEMTYVRYALPLWDRLGRSFGGLRVVRTHERLFPDILQDVVILFADDYGSETREVRYQTFERVCDLITERPAVDAGIELSALAAGERAFIGALLGDDLRALLRERVQPLTAPARESVAFHIGYVAGDKSFFHPGPDVAERYGLPGHSLRPTLTATRTLRGIGLRTSAIGGGRADRLFLPDPHLLTEGEREYIAAGEAAGVSARYKCRVREPWYVVPGTHVPDLVLSVFSESPLLLLNDAGCFASNSLLCGYCRPGVRAEDSVAAWYTSLTLLQCELEVHALGGGVMVMVPREAGNVRLPRGVAVSADHLGRLDAALRSGQPSDAYRLGDREVLCGRLGFTPAEVDLIRHGAANLTYWRTSARVSDGGGGGGVEAEV